MSLIPSLSCGLDTVVINHRTATSSPTVSASARRCVCLVWWWEFAMRVSTIIVVWTKQANKRISHAVMWFVVFVCYVPGAPLLDDDAGMCRWWCPPCVRSARQNSLCVSIQQLLLPVNERTSPNLTLSCGLCSFRCSSLLADRIDVRSSRVN